MERKTGARFLVSIHGNAVSDTCITDVREQVKIWMQLFITWNATHSALCRIRRYRCVFAVYTVLIYCHCLSVCLSVCTADWRAHCAQRGTWNNYWVSRPRRHCAV